MLLKGIYQYLFLGLLLVLAGLGCYSASQLEFSSKYEEFLPAEDEELLFYQNAKKQFSDGDPIFVIGLKHQKNIFDKVFLSRLRQLDAKLNELKGVKQSTSLVSIKNPVRGIFQIKEEFFIKEGFEEITRDTAQLFLYPDVYPKFISPDRKATCLYLILEKELPADFSNQVKKIIDQAGFVDAYYYGLQVAEKGYENNLKNEIVWLSVLSVFSVLVIVWLTFRSFYLLRMALVLILLTNVLTLGVAQVAGMTVNVLTVTIPAIVSIVCLSDLIHVFIRYREENHQDAVHSKISNTYSDLKTSLILTSLTTSLGFLSLIFTDVLPFTFLGVFASLGIVIAFLLTYWLVPLMLKFYKDNRKRIPSDDSNWFFDWIENNTRFLLIASTILLLSAGYFGTQVKVNTYLYDDLDAEDPLSEALTFFEDNFFGIRDLELYVSVKNPYQVYDEEVIRELDKLEKYLEVEYGARSVYSLVTLIKRYNRSYYGGAPAKFEIPANGKQLSKIKDYLVGEYSGDLHESLVAREGAFTRVLVKTSDQGSLVSAEKNKRLINFISEEIDAEIISIKLSGQPLFLDRSNEQITRYLFKSLLGAFLIIFLLLLILYRSLRLALIAFLVNVFPLVIMLGCMYWWDITLKKSTAVVFTIAFGIAVDDTIHFVSRFQLLLSRGVSLHEALSATWHATGKAILITSLILIGGFTSFAFSTFHSTFLTGTLISLSLVAAVFADLVLLPALLIRFFTGKGNKEDL